MSTYSFVEAWVSHGLTWLGVRPIDASYAGTRGGDTDVRFVNTSRGMVTLRRHRIGSPTSIAEEQRLTEVLRRNGFNCPDVLRGTDQSLVTLHEGRPVSAARFIPSVKNVQPSLVDVARLAKELHACPLVELPDWDPAWRDEQYLDLLLGRAIPSAFAEALRLAAECARRLQEAGDSVVVHHDLHADNLLHDGDRWYLIDFSEAHRGPRVVDCANLVLKWWNDPRRVFDDDSIEDVGRAYGPFAHQGLFPDAVALALAGGATEWLARGESRDWTGSESAAVLVELLSSSTWRDRLLRALARGTADSA